MSFFWPGDERMVAAAVAEARAAGVPEPVIEDVIAEETALGDNFSAPVIAGRLGAVARARHTFSRGDDDPMSTSTMTPATTTPPAPPETGTEAPSAPRRTRAPVGPPPRPRATSATRPAAT